MGFVAGFYYLGVPLGVAISLLLVGFVSSIFSSVGHNLILAGAVLPENSLKTMVSYVIGDTSGTFLCFFVMMLFFRNFRRI